MGNFSSDFLQLLAARGFIHQGTNLEGLDAAMRTPCTAYIGFDCTADSLHVGSLLPIMMLRHLQKTGHTPIVLMGGGTTRVGDPSGKDSARQLLTTEQITHNKAGIAQIFSRYLTMERTKMIDNADWLCNLSYLDFLREYGRHFSVNRMLGFDSVKLRLEREQPLSFLEFNYMVLQAYDFVELARRENCILQMGGSDQWGNIVSGVELGRRVLERELFGLTSPLLTTSAGHKMGKTASGAVWLNADRTSPYDFWQYWRNTEDADVERFLKLFTELPLSEIAKLAALRGQEINEAKIILATSVTTLCHGETAAQQAFETAKQTFTEGGAGESLPTLHLSPNQTLSLADALVALEMATSKGEARRLITGGGVRINDQKISDTQAFLPPIDADTPLKISAGKKRHGLVRVTG